MTPNKVASLFASVRHEAISLWDTYPHDVVELVIENFDELTGGETNFDVNTFAPTTIRINPFWAEYIPAEEVEAIIRHEFAHVQAGFRAKHGKRWAKHCVEFGVRPDVYVVPSAWKTMPWTPRAKVTLYNNADPASTLL